MSSIARASSVSATQARSPNTRANHSTCASRRCSLAGALAGKSGDRIATQSDRPRRWCAALPDVRDRASSMWARYASGSRLSRRAVAIRLPDHAIAATSRIEQTSATAPAVMSARFSSGLSQVPSPCPRYPHQIDSEADRVPSAARSAARRRTHARGDFLNRLSGLPFKLRSGNVRPGARRTDPDRLRSEDSFLRRWQ